MIDEAKGCLNFISEGLKNEKNHLVSLILLKMLQILKVRW